MGPRSPRDHHHQDSFAPVKIDIIVVLEAMVNAIGPKKVARSLCPKTDPDAGSKWVARCLNRARREFFHPHHIEAIFKMAHAIGFHDGKHAFDRVVGYHPSEAMTIDEKRDHLRRLIIEQQQQIGESQRRLEGLILDLGETAPPEKKP